MTQQPIVQQPTTPQQNLPQQIYPQLPPMHDVAPAHSQQPTVSVYQMANNDSINQYIKYIHSIYNHKKKKPFFRRQLHQTQIDEHKVPQGIYNILNVRRKGHKLQM